MSEQISIDYIKIGEYFPNNLLGPYLKFKQIYFKIIRIW